LRRLIWRSASSLHGRWTPEKENMMRKILIAGLIAGTLLLSACNTVKGLGRDIESVGEAGDKVI
jgi:predicted small secreted protein